MTFLRRRSSAYRASLSRIQRARVTGRERERAREWTGKLDARVRSYGLRALRDTMRRRVALKSRLSHPCFHKRWLARARKWVTDFKILTVCFVVTKFIPAGNKSLDISRVINALPWMIVEGDGAESHSDAHTLWILDYENVVRVVICFRFLNL